MGRGASIGRLLGAAVLSACALLAGVAEASAQRPVTGFLDREITVDGRAARYVVYVPHDYDENRAWPVILFLHGAGERGSDGLAQTDVGLGRAIRRAPERWPALVVFPQVPEDETWVGWSGDVAMAALDATVAEFAIDESRTYLTGLSMGGQGTWFLGWRHPERFAALVAICGFVEGGGRFPGFTSGRGADAFAEVAQALASRPVWIFHGDADRVVPVARSQAMHEALQSVGADVRYTELPGIGHNAWDPAYENPELPEWLLRHRR